ncbi:DUF697 domain-containing protein [Alteromonas sp. ASW11-19]|uniref:DUF697 domain-containing protein n=1 Tax=Alteromonas salexigens TaxID=2982530 RepID=A0ABT2VNU5_9ALTE|nr:YcjF family protein [Alteromonas salexigens]MCU7554775.1 DUF697 domain-containing protein [Alteromonas salexigens]
MSADTTQRYRSKVTERTINTVQPEADMPAKIDDSTWQPGTEKRSLSLGTTTLLLGGACAIGFGVVSAVEAVLGYFDSYPITATVLGSLLAGFVLCMLTLVGREAKGFMNVNKHLSRQLDYQALEQTSDKAALLASLKRHASSFSAHSYAARCYKTFTQALNSDVSAQEALALYQRTVVKPVDKRAQEVINKESMTAGSLTFISPNHLIQTLMIVWISFRTIRRVAQVYGLRPGTLGNWQLFKVLAQNIAAQSIFDLATDEVANQISGSLTARFMENSAEAVAAGALNVRLGKALMKLLR